MKHAKTSILLFAMALAIVTLSSTAAVADPPPVQLTVHIKGMTCGGCAKRVSTVIERIEHVTSATADAAAGTATVVCGAQLDKAALRKAVADAGFEVVSIEPAKKGEKNAPTR